ncbi:MAG: NAD(P)H-hydrate dehydratase, partial [Prochlorococcaceae cyanobacterium]
ALGADDWLRERGGPTWITPHRGEFNRLFPQWGEAPALEAAAAAAGLSGAAVLLKGARSVVAASDGRRWQLLEAAPAAARAGLGDVLAGYGAAIGAMALAAGGDANAALLATASLAHAKAGLRLQQRGAGRASPQAVARCLAAGNRD